MLKRDWGIHSRDDAITMIELGINGDIHANDFDSSFETYKKEYLHMHRRKKGRIRENKQQLFSNKVATCKTTIAWDIERAAMVIRYACTVGYIDEEEAYEYLKKLHSKTSESFNDWYEYGASFHLGRTFWRGSPSLATDDVEASFNRLLTKSSSIWWEYPLINNSGLKSDYS